MIAVALLLMLAERAPTPDPLLTEMQQLESSRNVAIKAGDLATLEKLYAADFTGIAGDGTRVDRPTLFSVFIRNAGKDFTADSKILAARKLSKRLVAVEGRLRLINSAGATISDSNYLHIFRHNGQHWEMVEGAAVPIAGPAR